MSEFFINIVNRSIAASFIVLAVLLLRLLLKKAPKWVTVLLWGIVAVRLICPFTVESVMSLIPSGETISPEIMMDKAPEINTGIPFINNTVNPAISGSLSPDPVASANPLRIWIPILSVVWIAGVVLLLAYTIISYWCVKRKVGTAVLLRDNIFQSETVVSSFVLGILQPKIYLSFHMDEQDMEHVIAHEQAHILRKDYWWKPLGFLLLTLHWFNPFMWLGYVLLCRDIEIACDEKVVKEMNIEQRADYSQALLACSVNRRMMAACPLAFGETGVKYRVKSVLSYKKPALGIIIAAMLASVVAAVCFLTDPASGRLKNIEHFKSLTEGTVAVLVSDGETYHSGTVSNDLLQELSDIKISRKEISMSRSEDRDKSHTLVLQTKRDTERTIYPNIKGLYIHFNSDFTSVWVENGVKPTLSYKVKNPLKVKELYDDFAIYNDSESAGSGGDNPANVITSADVEQLKAKFPKYFNLDTSKGLDVYIWQMSKGSYDCGLLSGENFGDTPEEQMELYQSQTSIEEMRAIIYYYISNGKITKNEVTIHAITMFLSSYQYKGIVDGAYRREINDLFWSGMPNV